MKLNLNKYLFSSFLKEGSDDSQQTYFKLVFKGVEKPYGEYSFDKVVTSLNSASESFCIVSAIGSNRI